MKKKLFLQAALMLFFSLTANSLLAQKSSEKQKAEITKAIERWNKSAKTANLEQAMAQFDESATIILVGSAKGEVCRGKEEARAWLTQIFGFAGFSWEMDKLDIDSNGKTAWVFMDGKMIVTFHKGGKRVNPYRFTGVMVKKKGEWKWRLFNGSVPQQE